MRRTKIVIAALFTVTAAPAFAQFGALFQNVVESAAKQAVQQGAQQGVQQGVTQAIAGAPAQAAPIAAPIIQNGCFFNLPTMPPGVQFNADLNGNGCVDQNEYATYMQVYQSSMANAAQRQQAAAPATSGNVAGAVLNTAVAARGAGLNGNATAWVAGQNAIGAAANAARGQPAQQVATASPDLNGDGIVTADEIAVYQARANATNGVVAQPTAQGAVSNATADVVSGAVGGALKGLFGH